LANVNTKSKSFFKKIFLSCEWYCVLLTVWGRGR